MLGAVIVLLLHSRLMHAAACPAPPATGPPDSPVAVSRACRQPDGTPAGPRIGSPWGLLGRASRLILLLVITDCALVGALTTPPYVVLLVEPAFGLLVSGVAAVLIRAFSESAEAPKTIVLSGAWATLVVPALAGMGALATAER